ncbi:MAG: carboxypeptidase regulatory-like domain-containing protein, partial [Armatimonadota bacterium]
KSTGAKIFYRPYDADPYNHDDGCLPSSQTGSQYADLVWAKISGLAQKPDAVGYRNEFNWDSAPGSATRRTCTEFINFKNRLRSLGYNGKVIFGSFGVGWVDSWVWDEPEVKAAVQAADGVETHEYFDLTVACCAPWLAFRHRDIAIAQHSYLRGKEWYIGEFGSDYLCGACPSCGDPQCRRGWRDRGKLTEQQYIDQMVAYSAGCADEVVAVFVFQQGAIGAWSDFETMGTSIATYMKSTWPPATGTISGFVRTPTGASIADATVTVSPGGYTTETNTAGTYVISGIPVGTYTVSASKTGYEFEIQAGKAVSAGQTTIVDFYLSPITAISSAKTLIDGTNVFITGIVTAMFPVGQPCSEFYIQNSSRSAGIRVVSSSPVSLSDEVQVQGSMATLEGERVLNGAAVIVLNSGVTMPKPLAMNNRKVGGGAYGYQGAVLNNSQSNEYATGLNNIGLLTRTWGRVQYVEPSGNYFYIDDGSGLTDGSGYRGIRVAIAGLPAPSPGSFVLVTGISSTTLIEGKTVRMLRPRHVNDLSYASSTNYLSNPGFETGNLSNWSVYGNSPAVQSGTWFGGITAHSGNYFVGLAVDGGTASGGIYQRVPVPAGCTYQASVWSRVFHLYNPSDSAQNRIGIDPDGGTNPTSTSIRWSPIDMQVTEGYSEWRQLTTPVVTCTGGFVTVFLDAKQMNSAGWHINCFDDACIFRTQ